MGDNDFPTVMANGAFLQGFMKKKGMISEQVTGQPPRALSYDCLLYTSPSPRDRQKSRMPSSA